jgi:hypothetical protein
MFNTISTKSEEELNYLEKRLTESRKYLEFGSGASTLMALRNSSLSIVSFDTNQEYMEYLVSEIELLDLPQENLTLSLVDIGPTGEWGRPLDESLIEKFSLYSRTPFQFIKSIFFVPDLILIDGRFRVAVFVQAIINCPGAIVIFDDYYDRPQYFEVETLWKPFEKCGRIAVFNSPPHLESGQVKKGHELLEKYTFAVD